MICSPCYSFIAAYLDEPFFQDGVIADSANRVARDRNVPYFSSAGNFKRDSWEGPFRRSGFFLELFGEMGELNTFSLGGTTGERQGISTSRDATITLQWNAPFVSRGGAPTGTRIAVLVRDRVTLENVFQGRGGTGTPAAQGSTDPIILIRIPRAGDFELLITLQSGPAPTLLKWIGFGLAVTSFDFNTASSTVFGHPNQPFTAAVGAVDFRNTPEFGTSPPLLEFFSSAGGTPVLFNVDGSPKSSAEIRNQPRFCATDGNLNTFFGSPSGSGFRFFGKLATDGNMKYFLVCFNCFSSEF